MKKSSVPASPDARLTSDQSGAPLPDLDLPVEPGFVSKPPRTSWEAGYELSEMYVAGANAAPGSAERRLRDKCRVEFVL